MEEVSNRTIAGLLIVAMVISLTGTFFSLSKLDMMDRTGGLAGFATNPNATAQLEIDDLLSISFIVDSVNWGSGRVNSSVDVFCNLTTTNMSIATHSAACNIGQWDTNPVPPPLVLKNDGNRRASVTFVANDTPAGWLGDSSGRLYFEVYNNLTGSCIGTRAGVDTVLSTSPLNLCDNFDFATGADQLNIPIKVSVPENVTGAKTVRLTATASPAS